MVVAEALSYGMPVVCFKNCGPGEFVNDECGIRIDYGRYDSTITEFAAALKKIYIDDRVFSRLSEGALNHFNETFDWNLKGDQLNRIYSQISSYAG
jgi:glycosyltransferase involved in cell wall biosynthesis